MLFSQSVRVVLMIRTAVSLDRANGLVDENPYNKAYNTVRQRLMLSH